MAIIWPTVDEARSRMRSSAASAGGSCKSQPTAPPSLDEYLFTSDWTAQSHRSMFLPDGRERFPRY